MRPAAILVTMNFSAALETNGRTATGIEVPAGVVDALGGGKRPKVTVSFKGHTYRSSIAPMGGRYMISVSAENRAASGAQPGDVLDVTVELDTAPREVSVPPDVSSALDAAPQARAAFDRLSYSHQLQHVLAVEAAKTPQTRTRRIEGMLAKLTGG